MSPLGALSQLALSLISRMLKQCQCFVLTITKKYEIMKMHNWTAREQPLSLLQTDRVDTNLESRPVMEQSTTKDGRNKTG